MSATPTSVSNPYFEGSLTLVLIICLGLSDGEKDKNGKKRRSRREGSG